MDQVMELVTVAVCFSDLQILFYNLNKMLENLCTSNLVYMINEKGEMLLKL